MSISTQIEMVKSLISNKARRRALLEIEQELRLLLDKEYSDEYLELLEEVNYLL
jgi:hypothetical protein